MEKSAKNISQRKFLKLSVSQRHKVLAQLAVAYGPEAWPQFVVRYGEMLTWSGLDHYLPPENLPPEQKRIECFHFHNRLAGNPLADPGPAVQSNLRWVPRFPVLVAVDILRTPYNAGSLLRLIDNFGFEGLVYSGPELSLEHPQLIKAARGCQHWIPVQHVDDLSGFLAASKRHIIGLECDNQTKPLAEFKPAGPMVVVLGNEQFGIGPESLAFCQTLFEIPIFGQKSAMNVTHAFAIFAYHVAQSWPKGAI
ncbi:MAG: TrmH family RNA methyltransferase [Acidobacteria bacterium]|nr:TrmH family RNA methyltransferase [Acidobacteriota bacterium]